MRQRRYALAAGVGSALAAALVFVAVERALDGERWGQVVGYAVAFGLFMAAWNALFIRLDRRQRTARNLIFEHTAAQYVGLLGAAWVLCASLEHLRWQELALYTLGGVPVLVLVWTLTRGSIKGEDPDELFA